MVYCRTLPDLTFPVTEWDLGTRLRLNQSHSSALCSAKPRSKEGTNQRDKSSYQSTPAVMFISSKTPILLQTTPAIIKKTGSAGRKIRIILDSGSHRSLGFLLNQLILRKMTLLEMWSDCGTLSHWGYQALNSQSKVSSPTLSHFGVGGMRYMCPGRTVVQSYLTTTRQAWND